MSCDKYYKKIGEGGGETGGYHRQLQGWKKKAKMRRVREEGDKMGEKDGERGKTRSEGKAVVQPNGLVSLALENSLRKGRETCIVQ